MRLESVGDANFNLSRYIKHKFDDKTKYTEEQEKNVEQMIYLVTGAQAKMALRPRTLLRRPSGECAADQG